MNHHASARYSHIWNAPMHQRISLNNHSFRCMDKVSRNDKALKHNRFTITEKYPTYNKQSIIHSLYNMGMIFTPFPRAEGLCASA